MIRTLVLKKCNAFGSRVFLCLSDSESGAMNRLMHEAKILEKELEHKTCAEVLLIIRAFLGEKIAEEVINALIE